MRDNRPTGDFTTSRQIFLLSILAVFIGIIGAFIAIILMKLIGLITNLSFFQRWSFAFTYPTHNHLGPYVILLPVIGGLLIGLIARYGSEKLRGHGIPEAIEAMLIHESRVQPRVAFWKPISAALSIGTGGPFGAEGPIIMTGGSLGSLLAQFFHLSGMERRILLVAGAAAGMSATFAAPIASVLFAVELLVFEFKPRSLVPIALASAVADVIRTALIGPGPLFGMGQVGQASVRLLVISAVVGIVGSLLAVLLTAAIYGVEDGFRKLPLHWMWWPALGGIVIGVGGYISPRALGVGYDSIGAMLNNQLSLKVLLALLIVKTVIWIIALGSGTSGGILAPILIIGGSLGGLAGDLLHAPHPGLWALLGMSAIFAGVTRSPFTSIVFPLELTHNLNALLPLLVASSVATGISAYILPRSILTEKIARRGLHLTREYSADPLQMHQVHEIVEMPGQTVPISATVDEVAVAIATLAQAPRWLGAVDERDEPLGLIATVDVFWAHANGEKRTMADFVQNLPTIGRQAACKIAMERMVAEGTPWVAVVADDNRVIGYVTNESLVCLRRREWEGEAKRQQVLGRRFQWRHVQSDGHDTTSRIAK